MEKISYCMYLIETGRRSLLIYLIIRRIVYENLLIYTDDFNKTFLIFQFDVFDHRIS